MDPKRIINICTKNNSVDTLQFAIQKAYDIFLHVYDKSKKDVVNTWDIKIPCICIKNDTQVDFLRDKVAFFLYWNHCSEVDFVDYCFEHDYTECTRIIDNISNHSSVNGAIFIIDRPSYDNQLISTIIKNVETSKNKNLYFIIVENENDNKVSETLKNKYEKTDFMLEYSFIELTSYFKNKYFDLSVPHFFIRKSINNFENSSILPLKIVFDNDKKLFQITNDYVITSKRQDIFDSIIEYLYRNTSQQVALLFNTELCGDASPIYKISCGIDKKLYIRKAIMNVEYRDKLKWCDAKKCDIIRLRNRILHENFTYCLYESKRGGNGR